MTDRSIPADETLKLQTKLKPKAKKKTSYNNRLGRCKKVVSLYCELGIEDGPDMQMLDQMLNWMFLRATSPTPPQTLFCFLTTSVPNEELQKELAFQHLG